MNKALYVLCAFLFMGPLFAQSLRFDQINVDNGLSQNTVNCMLKDAHGYLWIGTNDGLNKYDGYSIKTYKHQIGDSLSLANNKVYCLLEDRQGQLWVGTSNGISIYQKHSDQFLPAKHHPALENLKDYFIRSLFEDDLGNLWIGTLGQGLFRLAVSSNRLEQVPISHKQLAISDVSSILQGQNGAVWVATGAPGVFKFEVQSADYQFFHLKKVKVVLKVGRPYLKIV
ncbi:MAG: hypothetical protein HRU41_24150 [Saprospiraceae bacterium]|nr:hypothetical protein [Saprospiraceae bacterium]